jgi:hypothetical protein
MMTRFACVAVLSLAVLLGVRARAITAGEIDVSNTYENVGVILITIQPNDFFPEGLVAQICSGTHRRSDC